MFAPHLTFWCFSWVQRCFKHFHILDCSKQDLFFLLFSQGVHSLQWDELLWPFSVLTLKNHSSFNNTAVDITPIVLRCWWLIVLLGFQIKKALPQSLISFWVRFIFSKASLNAVFEAIYYSSLSVVLIEVDAPVICSPFLEHFVQKVVLIGIFYFG